MHTFARRLPASALGLVVLLGAASSQATTYYVDAVKGQDVGNDGSDGHPWKTIAKASADLQPGDVCILRDGTYRETLRPARSGTSDSPIVYRAASGNVFISGADPVSGWGLDSGDVYKATMAVDLGARKNQIFVDGQMMVEARWPNVPWTPNMGFDLLSAPLADATAAMGGDTVAIPSATQDAGFWTGATVWGEIGDKWTSQNATVTGSSPGTITITGKSDPWYPDSDAIFGNQGRVYLTGIRAALDSPGEWHLQDGTLFLMTVDRTDPSLHVVEARTGRLIVDLSLRSWIVIERINGYAGTVDMSGSNCTIQDATFRYVTHDFGQGYATRGGLDIGGTGNALSRSIVDTSSGNGVNLGGTLNAVRDCIVRNVNYHGDYSAGVNLSGSHNVLEYSTLTRAGRALVGPNGEAQTIQYNDLSLAMRLTQDGGAFYSWGVDGNGTTISYNLVHDSTPLPGANAPYVGIYLDDGCKNYVVHHNVVYGCQDGIRLGHIHPSSGHRVYNNTLVHNQNGMMQHGSDTFTDIRTWNNLSDVDGFIGTDLQKNLFTKNAMFVAEAMNDFRLQAGSPAIDYGAPIAGITDGFHGQAPDDGAYEFGGASWTVGPRMTPGAGGLNRDADGGSEAGMVEASVPDAFAAGEAGSAGQSNHASTDASGIDDAAAAMRTPDDSGAANDCSCSMIGDSMPRLRGFRWLAILVLGTALRRARRHGERRPRSSREARRRLPGLWR